MDNPIDGKLLERGGVSFTSKTSIVSGFRIFAGQQNSLFRLSSVSVLFLAAAVAVAANGPDPRAVNRWHAAYSYPQAGWLFVHIEGEPYERGLQHGHLLAAEIASYIKALAEFYGPQAPSLAWEDTRRLTNTLFLRGFTPEQLQEMKGIADGASIEGATFDHRPIDVIDIAALNAANEIDSLDGALDATATGLETMRPPRDNPAIPRRKQRTTRCSAFAAIGPATRDGKIVFGHVTMFDLYPANYYNIWIDLQPRTGHRFVMQTSPGGIQSGMDYAINDAGILLSETTLNQTRLAAGGIPLAARIRTVQQYADSIDKAAEILTQDGNGLSTTEWILADTHRNEIALLTLGTKTSKLYRSSRKEWIAGAEGFYWSDNNTKDLEVRLESIPGVESRPSTVGTFVPTKRDSVWLRMFDSHKGAIDAEFGRLVLTTPELVAAYAVDAKYTTTDLASGLKSWASFGPPVGAIRRPTITELRTSSAIKPLISNPWTILDPAAPIGNYEGKPADRTDLLKAPDVNKRVAHRTSEPAWHGTLIPASDADVWLTTAFANYERIVALEHKLRAESEDHELAPDDLDDIAVELAYYRSVYAHGARAGRDFPLAATQAAFRNENWYEVASGKGVLLLHTLRGILGPEKFDNVMDQFGRANAGKRVSSANFKSFLQRTTGRDLSSFFDWWLGRPGLPHIAVRRIQTVPDGKHWKTTVDLDPANTGPMLPVMVSVEDGSDELVTQEIISPEDSRIVVNSDTRPTRVTVDKHGLVARDNGSPFTILTFDTELEQTLLIYGTTDEEIGNREAARVLQQSLRRREHNVQPALKSDREVTDEDLRTHNIILIGRPSANAIAARYASKFPVHFDRQSFDVRGEVYSHPDTAVIAAADNPINPRYSMVVIAGLSSLATYQTMPQFEDDVFMYAPIVVLPHGGEEIDLVPPVEYAGK